MINDPAFQRQVSAYRRIPWEASTIPFSLGSLGLSFSGFLSILFYVLAVCAGLFWLLATFLVAKDPRYPRGFVFAEPLLLLGLLLALAGAFLASWTIAGPSEAFTILFQVVFSGLLGTAILTWLVRMFT